MPRSLVIDNEITIPAAEISVTFARSSGPGGQNVNKVNSKAILHWNVKESTALPEGIRTRFQKKHSHRITSNGEIVLKSERYRDQPKNVSDCYEKLRQLILAVRFAPKTRRKTRPSRSSIENRLKNKKQHSRKKQQRNRSWQDD